MRWSFQAIGSVPAVLKALDQANGGLTGQSKEEWDDAKPHLAGLVAANAGASMAVNITANGHATFETKTVEHDSEGSPVKTERTRTSGQCSVTIQPVYGFVTE